MPRVRAPGRAGSAAEACRPSSSASTATRGTIAARLARWRGRSPGRSPCAAAPRGHRRRPLPADDPLPRLRAPGRVTLHDVQHLDLPGLFSAATRAFRRLAWRPRGAPRADRDRPDRVRPRPRGRAARARPGARARRSTTGSTTTASGRAPRSASRSCSIPRRRGRTRTTRGCWRRSGCCGASGPSCGSCSRAAAFEPREGVEQRGRVSARRARGALPARVGARLPEPLRGLRPAAARGDGVRLPGRVLERGVAAGDLRRRRAALRPGLAGGDRRGGRRRCSTTRSRGGSAASSARRRSRGSARCAGARGRLPRAPRLTSRQPSSTAAAASRRRGWRAACTRCAPTTTPRRSARSPRGSGRCRSQTTIVLRVS